LPLPLVSSEKAYNAFIRLGCEPTRQKGSHLVLRRDTPSGRKSQVLVMGKHELARGTLRNVIRELGFTEQEFIDALR
jgi:predicted RNA binding protein YcfA (HicA-like mRNA interferase family)